MQMQRAKITLGETILIEKAPLSSEVATTCALTVQEILSALTIAISSSKCMLYICTQRDLVYRQLFRERL